MYRLGENVSVDLRTPTERRLFDLRVTGIIPLTWPQWGLDDPTKPINWQCVIDATADEVMPWMIDERRLTWKQIGGHDGKTDA